MSLSTATNEVPNNSSKGPTCLDYNWQTTLTLLQDIQTFGFDVVLTGSTTLRYVKDISDRRAHDVDIALVLKPEVADHLGVKSDRGLARGLKDRRIHFFEEILQRFSELPYIQKAFIFKSAEDFGVHHKEFCLTPHFNCYNCQKSACFDLDVGFCIENGELHKKSESKEFTFTNIETNKEETINLLLMPIEHTFVQKMRHISQLYRQQMHEQNRTNKLRLIGKLMKEYFDVCHLLRDEQIQNFIGTDAYREMKLLEFGTKEQIDLSKNPAYNTLKLSSRKSFNSAFSAFIKKDASCTIDFQYALDKIEAFLPKL